ncbi:unnamed protein product [[Candida] boidinii]|nr:unnamed protein product [[Candida] boidinii]
MPPKFNPNVNTFQPGGDNQNPEGSNQQGYQGSNGYGNNNNNYQKNYNKNYNNNQQQYQGYNARTPTPKGAPIKAKKGNKMVSIDDFLKTQEPATPEPESLVATPDSLSGMSTPMSHAASTSSLASMASLNTALQKLSVEPLKANLINLQNSQKISEAREECDQIAEIMFSYGASSINDWQITEVIKSLSRPKNPALIRESSMLLLQTISRKFAGKTPYEAYFVQFFGPALDLLSDKENTVKRAAQAAADSLLGMFPTEACPSVLLTEFLAYLKGSAKWPGKIAALKFVDRFIEESPADLLELRFVDAIPVITDIATDFKPELAKAGMKTLNSLVKVLDNLDLAPRYDIIVETLADPSKVPTCIKTLSSVTFVAEVTEPALSLLVPILDKSLKLSSSSQEQLRQTVIVIENLTRLVNNKREIETYIPILLPGVKKIVETASLPEVRDLASKALSVIEDAEAEHADGKFHGKLHLEQAASFIADIKEKINDDLIFSYLTNILMFDSNVNDWTRLSDYFKMAGSSFFANEDEKDKYVESLIHKLRELFTPDAVDDSDEDGIVIVNTDFSLAYGSRMLLNKTTMRLVKGHRYGLCGRNGAGKSTLMRAIANGQLEGFPDQSELRTCFVEHKMQGAEADMDLVAFIGSDPELEHISKEEISDALANVGFDESRRAQSVGSLSGGWKMKLELARAIYCLY